MRIRLLTTTVLLMSVALARSAAAQARVPDEGMASIGAEIGFFFPEEIFETGTAAAVSLDYYVNPRFGLRGSLGWVDPNFERSGDSLRQIRLSVDGMYNWEHGKWHPFAGGGLGVYLLQHKLSGRSVGVEETKLGVRVGGGIEYFMRRTVTIKGEALYHGVQQGQLPWSPSGVTLTIGIKKYF